MPPRPNTSAPPAQKLLHSRYRAGFEGVACLAGVEFYNIRREVAGADVGACLVGELGECRCEQPRNAHSHVVGLSALYGALLGDLGFALDRFVIRFYAVEIEAIDTRKDSIEPLFAKEVGHCNDYGKAHLKLALRVEPALQKTPNNLFVGARNPLSIGAIGVAYSPII